jgi:transaldolase
MVVAATLLFSDAADAAATTGATTWAVFCGRRQKAARIYGT